MLSFRPSSVYLLSTLLLCLLSSFLFLNHFPESLHFYALSLNLLLISFILCISCCFTVFKSTSLLANLSYMLWLILWACLLVGCRWNCWGSLKDDGILVVDNVGSIYLYILISCGKNLWSVYRKSTYTDWHMLALTTIQCTCTQ